MNLHWFLANSKYLFFIKSGFTDFFTLKKSEITIITIVKSFKLTL